MTNYPAIAGSPTAAGSLNSTDILVLNNPDNPFDNKATTLAIMAVKLAALAQPIVTTAAGAGFSGGVGTIIKSAVYTVGTIKYVEWIIDLTGLGSSTTDLDIIGTGSSAAYFGQVLAAEIGTVYGIEMKCLRLPAGGVTDIDLYSATENTGVFDGLVTALTETALITAGGAWTNGAIKGSTANPAANEYLYLTCGAGGTPGTYTGGKFKITMYGY